MKPFITEEQLALYKYQRGSKYYGMPMSNILHLEFVDFLNTQHLKRIREYQGYSDFRELLKFFEYFMHRKIENDTWEIWCPDLSCFYLCFEKSDVSSSGEHCRFYSVPPLPDE